MRVSTQAVRTAWRAVWCAVVVLALPADARAQEAEEEPPAIITAANAPVIYRQLERRIRIESDGRSTARGAVTCVDGGAPCSLVLYRISDAVQRASSDTGVE